MAAYRPGVKKLTTTSYALLGLLAVKPWSAYELTRHMQRSSLRLLWPRAESQFYEEPKNLVAHRLATSAREKRGAGWRTVYRITRKGRAALREWLSRPGHGLVTEFEGMLKIAYADSGSKAQLLENLRQLRHHLQALIDLMRRVFEGLLDEGPTMPERFHITALVSRFHVAILRAQADWIAWAMDVVERWPTTRIDAAMAAESREILGGLVDELRRLGGKSARSLRDGEPRGKRWIDARSTRGGR